VSVLYMLYCCSANTSILISCCPAIKSSMLHMLPCRAFGHLYTACYELVVLVLLPMPCMCLTVDMCVTSFGVVHLPCRACGCLWPGPWLCGQVWPYLGAHPTGPAADCLPHTPLHRVCGRELHCESGGSVG
jgi:hypothetical protein